MHPWMSQSVAEDHRQDLERAARRHRRPGADDDGQASRSTWDTKLGWALIGLGCRLVALRATPPDAPAVRSL